MLVPAFSSINFACLDNRVSGIALDSYNQTSFPSDAKTAAKANLRNILQKIYSNLSNEQLDYYTKIHLESSAEDIEDIFAAKLSID